VKMRKALGSRGIRYGLIFVLALIVGVAVRVCGRLVVRTRFNGLGRARSAILLEVDGGDLVVRLGLFHRRSLSAR
jgi:hypothetical protein